jgi:Tfp pilus assembly protein PilF
MGPASVAQGNDPSAQEHVRRANQFLTAQRPDKAIPEFAAALAADPTNLDVKGNLGVLLYFQGELAKAEPYLREVVQQQKVPKIQALLGMCERRRGEAELAKNDLAAAVPKLEEAGIRKQAGLELIEMYTASSELPQAANTVAILKEGSPTDPQILYVAYRIYIDLAGESMLDLSLAAPGSAQMHQAMAHELQRERDTKGAIKNYRQALAVDPNLPGIHYELAEVLRASSEPALHAEAEQQYQLALKVNPNDVKSITRVGEIAEEKGEAKQAEEMYRRALTLQAADLDASIDLAHVLVEQNQLEAALPLLERVIAADPTNVLAHFRLSALYRRLKMPEDAKREVAAYEKYKDLKEKLRKVYEEMRMDAPQSTSTGK